MSSEISIREFARREGVSDTLVRRGIKEGRIKALPSGKLDPSLVGSGWRPGANTANPSANKGANTANNANTPQFVDDEFEVAPGESLEGAAARFLATGKVVMHDYAEALRRKENYLALLRQLEYETKSGDLIPLPEAEAAIFEEFRSFRDAWMNWPTRVGPLIAADLGIEPGRVIEALHHHVHKQLADLGEIDASRLLEKE